MKHTPKIVVVSIIILVLGAYWFYTQQTKNPDSQEVVWSGTVLVETPKTPESPEVIPLPDVLGEKIISPISWASDRITKKSFGTYVTPQDSPVSPERFRGYHTGVDFETTESEKDDDVEITALCSGKLVKKWVATGYGGYAVQSCTIDDKEVTVVYWHLRESSIKSAVDDELVAGDSLWVLWTWSSDETDNERKHLHLSIHLWSDVNIMGYTQSESELSGWLDPKTILWL